MTVYIIYEHKNYVELVPQKDSNKKPIRVDQGNFYVEEKHFESEYDAGIFVGGFSNKDIIYTDKTAAYKQMFKLNKDKMTKLFNLI